MANAPRKNSTKAREALRATSKNTVHPYFIARPDKDAANASWTVAELCKEYGWPEGLAGGGKIALIHCSGGWRQEDIDAYFADPKLRPIVTDHSVDLITKNSECKTANVADTEVALDIQVAGAAYAIATGKSATIRIYWSQDLVAGLRAASDDKCDVCCITWGADENNWGRAAAYAFDAVAEKATKKGMIIIAASGDNDSSDGGSTPANVDFPASSPHVIGVGGTTRTKDAKVAENVWNDNPGEAYGNGTGGGVSEFFPIPKWQLATIQSLNRIVPDVAAHADPNNGYQIIVGDESRVVGGTSAAAALYAGLFAAFGEKRGFILPELYKNQICFNDIREGDNGQFRALVGAQGCSTLSTEAQMQQF
jgi:kumamolisin